MTRSVLLLAAMAAGCQSPPFAGSRIDPPTFRDRQLAEQDVVEPKAKRTTIDEDATDTRTADSAVKRATFETEPAAGTGIQLASGSRVAETPATAEPDDLTRAHAEAARGNFDQAKLLYRRVLQQQPANADAHHRLAIIADRQQDFLTAEQHYQSALRLTPGNADLWSDLGYSYLLQDKLDQSERILHEALRLSPGNPRVLNNLALVHARRGDAQQALALFRQTGTEAEAYAKLALLFPGGQPQATFAAPQAGTIRPPLEAPPPGQFSSYSPNSFAGNGAALGQSQSTHVSTQTPPPSQGAATAPPLYASSGGAIASVPLSPVGTQPGTPAPTANVTAYPPSGPVASAGRSVDPLDSMPEWPPASGSFAAQATMPDHWPGTAAPDSAPSLPHVAPRQTAPGTSLTAGHAAPAPQHNIAISPMQTPAQRAAILGMQAGPGGMFPIGTSAPAISPASTTAPAPANSTAAPAATIPPSAFYPTATGHAVPPSASHIAAPVSAPATTAAVQPWPYQPGSPQAAGAAQNSALPQPGTAVMPAAWNNGIQQVSGSTGPSAPPMTTQPLSYAASPQYAPAAADWTHVPPMR